MSARRRTATAPAPAEETLRGTVARLFFSSAGFSAGQLELDAAAGRGRVPFAGNLCTREGARVVLHGAWRQDPKWGRQFYVASLETDQALDATGLAAYLTNNPHFAGIGPVRARRIAEEFGAQFGEVLVQEPERIARAARVSLDVIQAVRDEWLRTATTNATATALAAYGLTHHQVEKLIDEYGNSTLEILQRDPYAILGTIDGFGFFRVDQVARKVGIPKDHPGRIRAGLIHCVAEALQDGHCYVEWRGLIDQANRLLVMDQLDAKQVLEAALGELVAPDQKKPALVCIGIDNALLVSRPRSYEMEAWLAREVFARHAYPNPHCTALDLEAATTGLLEGQALAVRAAHDHGLVLVSGGAGVGKTFTVAAITQMYLAARLRVVLCAPTGKAAKRLEQVVGRDAATIHRLLGYQGDSWLIDEDPDWRVDADLVVVDEMSMVDAPLCYQLFRALDLAKTAVVLVGDHNQLPPVGPGNPLRDLIERRPIPTVILDQVVRQAGALKINSTAILCGEVAKTEPADPNTKPPRSPWIVITRDATTTEDVAGLVLYLFESKLEQLGFDLATEVQLLTPTHKGPLGTVALNTALQRVLQQKLHGFEVPPARSQRGFDFHQHDRVIQTKNNYDLGVMNGAIGTVTDVGRRGGELTATFEGIPIEYTAAMGGTGQLSLAYALTIHKMQGSETPCAVVVCHKSHAFQHHRNLLYTAVTRARKTAILVGDSWGIRNCAQRTNLEQRNTWLRVLDL